MAATFGCLADRPNCRLLKSDPVLLRQAGQDTFVVLGQTQSHRHAPMIPMRYPRTQRCARWAASRRLLWPVGSLMPASSGAERLQKGVEGKGAHVRSRAQGARDVQAVRDEGNRDGAGTVSAAGEFLTREFSASVADGSSPAGSDLLGSQVHSLVYVPRDAAAGRVRAPLVVCCHGLGESGLRVAGIAQRFATAGAVAVVPSFRGGGAPTAGSMTGMSVLTELADLEAVLDAAGAWPFVDAGRTALFGRSQGGLVAVLAAARRPTRMSALVLWYPALRLPQTTRARFGSASSASAVPQTFTHRVDGRDVTLGRRYAVDAWSLDIDAELARLAASPGAAGPRRAGRRCADLGVRECGAPAAGRPPRADSRCRPWIRRRAIRRRRGAHRGLPGLVRGAGGRLIRLPDSQEFLGIAWHCRCA